MGLLAAGEPPPFDLVQGSAPIILWCDHASNRIPAALGDLGLAPEHLVDHIAWDIGALGVLQALRDRFDATSVTANYSRLVVDLNRSLADASAYPRISDGVLVPGNIGLTDKDRAARADALFHPYHDAIDAEIERLSDSERGPVCIGVHSFTPDVHELGRPWQIGVLWHRDPRIPLPLLAGLRREPGVVVGDNEPYSGHHPADFTIDSHPEPLGLAHVGIEIRQDVIEDEAGQRRYADILARALEPVLADEALYRPRVVHEAAP